MEHGKLKRNLDYSISEPFKIFALIPIEVITLVLPLGDEGLNAVRVLSNVICINHIKCPSTSHFVADENHIILKKKKKN